jgi:hypothetical protein
VVGGYESVVVCGRRYTPPSNNDDAWSYDDLEIDVWGDEGGFRGVVDEEVDQVRLALPLSERDCELCAGVPGRDCRTHE